jgi:hypothetical protein
MHLGGLRQDAVEVETQRSYSVGDAWCHGLLKASEGPVSIRR